MVLGRNIFLTRHFFRIVEEAGEKQMTMAWLDILSHELVHLRQISEQRSLISFYTKLIWQYISSLSYSGAEFEKEAEFERSRFRRIMQGKQGRELLSLIASDRDDADKCMLIRAMWPGFLQN